MAVTLEIEKLSKSIAGVPVLSGVDLRLELPFMAALVGTNGAGKSTLLRIVAGITRPDRGDVRFHGRSVARDVAVRRQMAYVPDNPRPLAHMTVAEMISTVAALRNSVAPGNALIGSLGVEPFLGQRVASLSLGQARRAALLTSLIGDPDLLVLDEPSNGLDADGLRILQRLLLERVGRGKAVLLSTHSWDFARGLGARVLELRAGTVALGKEGFGTPG